MVLHCAIIRFIYLMLSISHFVGKNLFCGKLLEYYNNRATVYMLKASSLKQK